MSRRNKKQVSEDAYTKYYESKDKRLEAEAIARATSGSWLTVAEKILKRGNSPELKDLKKQIESRLKNPKLSRQERTQFKSLYALALKKLEEQKARVAADKKLVKYLEEAKKE
jgi:hypothetical protein